MDNLTSEQRKKNMSHIRNKDSGIEMRLRRALWHRGYRYRKNWNALPGKPDIVLTKYRIAIFVDSEFFHGKDWDAVLQNRIRKGSNPEYWEKKITRNMERDREVTATLNGLGWKVLRFWGRDIIKNLDDCIIAVDEAVEDIMIGQDSTW